MLRSFQVLTLRFLTGGLSVPTMPSIRDKNVMLTEGCTWRGVCGGAGKAVGALFHPPGEARV